MDRSPAAAAEHLGHVRGWWGCSHGAAVDLEAEGRCLWASPLTAVFSPLTILSVLGLIRLIFAPWFALKSVPPFPEIISAGRWMQTPC